LLRRCGSTLSEEKQRSEFARVDGNGDGRIDWNEFKKWWETK
jgi:Ca2+-binding EF-hand superfamily protein